MRLPKTKPSLYTTDATNELIQLILQQRDLILGYVMWLFDVPVKFVDEVMNSIDKGLHLNHCIQFETGFRQRAERRDQIQSAPKRIATKLRRGSS